MKVYKKNACGILRYGGIGDWRVETQVRNIHENI